MDGKFSHLSSIVEVEQPSVEQVSFSSFSDTHGQKVDWPAWGHNPVVLSLL